MPYLQVDLDGKRKWPMVAAGCGISEAEACKGFLDLWEACWREKSSTVSLLYLECLFACPGRGERVAEVLGAFGFLDAADGVLRVCGADKYLRITEARVAGGKKAASNLKRGKSPGSSRKAAGKQPGDTSGSRPALTPNTEHQSPSSKEETTAPADAAPSRLKLLTARLCDDVQEILRRKYLHQGAKDTDALKRILSTGASDFEIRARFRSGLRVGDPKNWLCVRTFAQLGQKWNDLAGYGDPPPREPEPPRPRLPPPEAMNGAAEAMRNEEIPF